MSIDQMRDYVSRVYDSKNWTDRVKRMPNNQVAAIYKNMLNRGYFNKPLHLPRKEYASGFRQATIFDYIPEEQLYV